MPAEEYARWAVGFAAAKTAMTGRDAALEAAAELIERDLVLLGATAIEDKLQKVLSSNLHPPPGDVVVVTWRSPASSLVLRRWN